MKALIIGLIALASVGACDGTKRDKVTRIEEPGQFSAGLCGGRTDEWLITLNNTKAICVKPDVGKKQTVGFYFIP